MKKNLRFLMLTLLCAVFSVAWGDTSTLEFSAACGGSGTADDGAVWTVTSDANESSFDSNKGIHYGTSNAAVSYLNLTTSSISKTITQIVVNASGASGTTAKLNVKVGGNAFGVEKNLTSSATDYTFTGSAQGTIVVKLSQNSAKKALYVKKIVVTYGDGSVTPIEPTDPDVSFEKDVVEIKIDDYFTNKITKPNGINVEYSLAQDGDAIVQLSTNNNGYPVVKGLSAGSTTVFATWAATTYYNAGRKSFSVNVSRKAANLSVNNLSIIAGNTKNLDYSSVSDGLITFEINDPQIASIEKVGNNYVVTGLTAGETTVTATQAATGVYEQDVKSFTITVKEGIVGAMFYESFDEFNASSYTSVNWSGGSNTAVNNSNDVSDNEGWSYTQAYANFQCLKLGGSSTLGKAVTPALALLGNGSLTFNSGAWGGNDETTLKLSIEKGYFLIGNEKKDKTTVDLKKEEWTEFSIALSDLESGTKITFEGNKAGKARFFLDEVRVTAESSEFVSATFNTKFKGYTSIYYSDKNLVVPEKVTGLTYYVEDGRGHFNNDYPAGSVIPKNTAVVLEYENLPEEGATVRFKETTLKGTAPARNMLRGFDIAQTTTVDAGQNPADYFFYRLTVGAVGSGKEGDVGFYWGEEDGAPFQAGAHKVYLAVEKSQFANAIQASSIIIDDSDNISEIAIPEKTIEGVYTLSGRRVYGNNLPKGIYIVNGKKMVIK